MMNKDLMACAEKIDNLRTEMLYDPELEELEGVNHVAYEQMMIAFSHMELAYRHMKIAYEYQTKG